MTLKPQCRHDGETTQKIFKSKHARGEQVNTYCHCGEFIGCAFKENPHKPESLGYPAANGESVKPKVSKEIATS